MRLLLDTHVLLWLRQTPDRIGGHARRSLDEAEQALVSVVTFVEIGIKGATGKLTPPEDFREAVPDERILPITPEHGMALRSLPVHHRDPFDRLLIAQAMAEDLTIVTADAAFSKYDVRVIDASV